MVDINPIEKKFSGHPPQSRVQALQETIQVLDLVARAGRRLEDALRPGLEAAGLSAAQGRALAAIAAAPGMTVGELTAHLGVSKQSLAPVLKGLIVRGHVAAAETRADRRRRLLRLTPQGEAVWREASLGALGLVAPALAGAGPPAAAALCAVLRRLAGADEGAGAFPAGAP